MQPRSLPEVEMEPLADERSHNVRRGPSQTHTNRENACQQCQHNTTYALLQLVHSL